METTVRTHAKTHVLACSVRLKINPFEEDLTPQRLTGFMGVKKVPASKIKPSAQCVYEHL
jgi:hypothetical protein